jgi:PTH2 family peptidyl-tRNA hydrolase
MTGEVKQVIVIRRDLRMRRGKEIAQGAHASMAWLTRRLAFEDNQHNCPSQFCKHLEYAGHTEFHGEPTLTAVAIGPDYDDKIDLVTGSLTLY